MKIRGKLILWFGSLVLLILMAYSVVVYMTFKETISQGQDEKFGNQALAAILTCEEQVAKVVNRVDDILFVLDDRTTLTGIDMDRVILQKAIASSPLLRGAAIISGDDLRLGVGDTPEPRALKSLLTTLKVNSREHNSVKIADGNGNNGNLILFIVRGSQYHDASHVTLLLSIDRRELSRIFHSSLLLNNTRLLIFSGAKTFEDLTSPETARLDSPGTAEEVRRLSAGHIGRFVIMKNWYIFRPARQLLGLDLVYMLPADIHLAGLVKLKNRVIAATIILAWIAVWAILILAYRISNPLAKLARVTNDMITFNYQTPLDFSPTNDEIGTLARSIDTMRQRIEQLVIRDPLTRTYNRLYLMHTFENVFARALRLNENLCCIILDIDFFKQVNDTYGHQTGDDILRLVAEILLRNTREYDTVATVARYGGEEFVILLSQVDKDAARIIAERLRVGVESKELPHGIKCTISLGLANLSPERHSCPDALLEDADAALYQAKESGRNRLVVSENTGLENVKPLEISTEKG